MAISKLFGIIIAMIKYIGFDKDGTLFDVEPAKRRWWGKIIHEDFGIDANEARKIFAVVAPGQPTYLQPALTLKRHNISFSKAELFKKGNEIASRLGKAIKGELFPEVLGVIKQLKEQGYLIFVSSNHQETVVKNDLERTGLIKSWIYLWVYVPVSRNLKKVLRILKQRQGTLG